MSDKRGVWSARGGSMKPVDPASEQASACTCPPSWWEKPTSERPHHHHERCPYFGEPVREQASAPRRMNAGNPRFVAAPHAREHNETQHCTRLYGCTPVCACEGILSPTYGPHHLEGCPWRLGAMVCDLPIEQASASVGPMEAWVLSCLRPFYESKESIGASSALPAEWAKDLARTLDKRIAAQAQEIAALRAALEQSARACHIESLYSAHMNKPFEECPDARCQAARAALRMARTGP